MISMKDRGAYILKVYIVRHGEVDHNRYNLYNNLDEDLNEVGVGQALKLKEKIKDIDYDVVFCSPLKRARHTADIIVNKDKKIIIDNRLEERNPGSLSGQPLEVTNRDEYWNYYTKIRYGTSEDIVAFFERVFSFLDELKKKEYDQVLIVGHSGISKAFSAYFDGIEDGMFLNRGLKNCEIREYYL